jgi:hypothetical protein
MGCRFGFDPSRSACLPASDKRPLCRLVPLVPPLETFRCQRKTKPACRMQDFGTPPAADDIACSDSIAIDRRQYCRGDKCRSGGEAEAVEDLPYGLRWIDSAEDHPQPKAFVGSTVNTEQQTCGQMCPRRWVNRDSKGTPRKGSRSFRCLPDDPRKVCPDRPSHFAVGGTGGSPVGNEQTIGVAVPQYGFPCYA